MRQKTMFLHVMQFLMDYASAYSLQYKVFFVNDQVMDIFEDTMSSGFLLTGSCAT